MSSTYTTFAIAVPRHLNSDIISTTYFADYGLKLIQRHCVLLGFQYKGNEVVTQSKHQTTVPNHCVSQRSYLTITCSTGATV
jgi:hypothetical protein